MSSHNSTKDLPEEKPKNGFYYHYKHNPDGEMNDYAYEVLGIGFHTEDNCRPEDKHTVIYRPLYKDPDFESKDLFYIRPLKMFIENVTKEGKTFARFQMITDPDTIKKLEAIRRDIYEA